MNKRVSRIVLIALVISTAASGLFHLLFAQMHWPGSKEFFLWFKTSLTLLGLFIAFLVLREMLKDSKQ